MSFSVATCSGRLDNRHGAVKVARRSGVPSIRIITRSTYDVEVEPAPSRAPNNAPRFGSGPPPPPPPPPPPTRRLPQPPTRRELLFGALGLGLGVAGTYSYENRPLDPDEVAGKLTSILDDIFEDEALLELLGEEIVLRQQMEQTEDSMSALEMLKAVDDAIAAAAAESEAQPEGGK